MFFSIPVPVSFRPFTAVHRSKVVIDPRVIHRMIYLFSRGGRNSERARVPSIARRVEPSVEANFRSFDRTVTAGWPAVRPVSSRRIRRRGAFGSRPRRWCRNRSIRSHGRFHSRARLEPSRRVGRERGSASASIRSVDVFGRACDRTLEFGPCRPSFRPCDRRWRGLVSRSGESAFEARFRKSVVEEKEKENVGVRVRRTRLRSWPASGRAQTLPLWTPYSVYWSFERNLFALLSVSIPRRAASSWWSSSYTSSSRVVS